VPSKGIRDEVVTFHVDGVGNVAAVLPVIPEDAPYRVREGIARRRVAAITGKCPCGAQVDYQAARSNGKGALEVVHDRLCPADTARLTRAARRWLR
jgi:hypothetical protein